MMFINEVQPIVSKSSTTIIDEKLRFKVYNLYLNSTILITFSLFILSFDILLRHMSTNYMQSIHMSPSN